MAHDPEQMVSAELFDEVIEYIKKLQARSRGWTEDEEDDDFLTDDHPLVTFCQDLLEQLSSHSLTQTIIGFGPQSRRRLAIERRRLERRKRSKPFQRLLFQFETVSSTLGTARYATSEEDTHEFLSTEFLDLLKAVAAYLKDTRPVAHETAAAEGALSELEYYLDVEPDGT